MCFNFLLDTAAMPTKPVPRSSMVAGSGTGATVEKSSKPYPSFRVLVVQVMVSRKFSEEIPTNHRLPSLSFDDHA